MLPISALPSAPAPVSGGDMPAAQIGEAAQGADFLALLNIQTDDITAAPLPDVQLEATPLSNGPAITAAMILPDSGKSLPSALPQLPQMPQLPEAADPAPDASIPPPVALPLALTRSLFARLRPEEPAAPVKGKTLDETPVLAVEEEPQPETAPPVIAALPNLGQPAEAALTDLQTATAAPAARAVPAKPQPFAAKPSPETRPAPDVQQLLTVSANPAPEPTAQQPIPAAPVMDTAPQIAANLRVAARSQTAESEPILPAAPSDQLTSVAAPFAPTALSAPPELAQPAPVTRPQEFATLVDRLVAAREALQPQAVSVAVQHAQFGQVQVHFRQDDLGLSVSLANADPDFARAVNAAVPPVLAAGTADGTSLGSSNRQDQPATGTSDTPGQQRGQSSAQREERGARANSAPQANRSQPQGASTQPDQGIYA